MHSGNLELQDLSDKQLHEKFICGEHFRDSDIKLVDPKGMIKLKDIAIPKDKATTAVFEALQNNDDLNTSHNSNFQLNDEIPLLLNSEPTFENLYSTSFDFNCDQSYNLSTTADAQQLNDGIYNKDLVQKLQNQLLKKMKNLKKLKTR